MSNSTEQTVARLADAIAAQSNNLASLSASVERLERGISAMVEEGRSQREVMNNLIKLCTSLVERQAS
ncbi:MAG: hypothetical protein AAGJ80_00075 [Cyanobacteria bacterium J06553_1]